MSSSKTTAIAETIKDRIICGELTPGTKLPTLSEIENQFKVSRMTAQWAFDRLRDDGYITGQGRKGTFVVERPPHLRRFGLVVSDPPHGYYMNALVQAARSQAESLNGECRVYMTSDIELLQEDIERRRLAGLILGCKIHDQALLWKDGNESTVPLVSLGSDMAKGKGLGLIFDWNAVLDETLVQVEKRGKKKLALIVGSDFGRSPDELLAWVEPKAIRHQLMTKRKWFQGVDPGHPEWATSLMELLFSHDPPDSLLILNDHLVEPITKTLDGLDLKNRVVVIGHANFPVVSPAAFPIIRIGYDAMEMMKRSFEWIQKKRTGNVKKSSTRQQVRAVVKEFNER